MNIRNTLMSIVAASALTPILALAAPGAAPARACAAAFAGKLAASGVGTPHFRVDYRGDNDFSSVSSFYETDYTFQMQVIDAKSGAPLAVATCTADSHGKVTVVTDKL